MAGLEQQHQHEAHVTLPETPAVPSTAHSEVRMFGLVLGGLALIFSLISLIIMACNKHGQGRQFDEYEEFRYVLAIAILAALYTGAQCMRHLHEFSTRSSVLSRRTGRLP